MVGLDIFAPTQEVNCTLWRENVSVFRLFEAVSTQWRVGMAGPTGFDYPAVFATMDRLFRALGEEKRDAMFMDLQVMESEALAAMAKLRK